MSARRSFLPGLEPFGIRDFAAFWVSSATTQVAGLMEVAATSWIIYEMTGSPVLLGLNGLFRAGPTLALALLGGALADRGSRKRLLLASQAVLLGAAILLALLVASGRIAFWHFYAVSAVIATVGAVSQPSRMSLYPSLVPRAQLQNAVNLNTLPHRLAVLIGPAVAGFLIARVSGPAAYVAVAALQAFALVLLTTIRVPPGAPRPRSSLAELAVGGLRYTVRSRLLPALLFLELVMLLFGYGAVLLTVFARDVLRAGPEGLGVLYGAAGAGAILASAGLIATGDIERKGRLLFAAAGAYAVAFLAFAGSSLLALSVGLMFVAGAAEALWGAMRQSILQLVIEDAYRGRVMSLLVIGFNGVTQVGQLTIGFLIAAFGAPAAGAFGALAVGAAVVTVAVRRPELRRFTGTGEERVSGVEASIETSIPAT